MIDISCLRCIFHPVCASLVRSIQIFSIETFLILRSTATQFVVEGALVMFRTLNIYI